MGKEIKHFIDVDCDIIDLVEFRRLWFTFGGWSVVKDYGKVGRTYFDLIVEKNNKKIGVVAVENDDDVKHLSSLRTYLKYVDEIQFLTSKEELFWEVYEKYAGKRKGWKVVMLDGSNNNYKFVHFK